MGPRRAAFDQEHPSRCAPPRTATRRLSAATGLDHVWLVRRRRTARLPCCESVHWHRSLGLFEGSAQQCFNETRHRCGMVWLSVAPWLASTRLWASRWLRMLAMARRREHFAQACHCTVTCLPASAAQHGRPWRMLGGFWSARRYLWWVPAQSCRRRCLVYRCLHVCGGMCGRVWYVLYL